MSKVRQSTTTIFLNWYAYIFFILFLTATLQAKAQEENDDKEGRLSYRIERQLTIGNGQAPLWLNANKYGLSSIKESNGYIRAGFWGKTPLGYSENWNFHYAADVAVAYYFSSTFIIQQLYGDLSYKKLHLTLGSKQRPANLKNAELSSGSQTFGINARPVPELRIETPEYFDLLPHSHWLGLKFEFGYGMMTDSRWQKHFVAEGYPYSDKVLYHTQSGFLRIGDENRFPLTIEGGLEWACQFGGTAKNINYGYGTYKDIKMGQRFKNFFQAIYGGGSDPTDAGYNNAEGNTLGSWLLSIGYKIADNAKIRLYYDHYFEDHSQLFMEYGWKDGLYGLEVALPTNRIVSSAVYEYLHTSDQSGPIYHDRTTAVTDQISGADNYYNHGIYVGWQHWGQAIGNPLYISPINNKDHTLSFKNNRFTGHHIGICGDPTSEIHYRMLYTYTTNLGTYNAPYDFRIHNTSFLAELSYAPHRIGRWITEGNTIRLGFGFDKGRLLGNNTAFQLTFCSKGNIFR